MVRLRGRRLHPESGRGDGECYADGCWSPPSPPVTQPALAPAPAPPPSRRTSPQPCPPDLAPSPARVRGAAGGRRDQGRVQGHGSPPGDKHHHRLVVTSALAAAAAIAFISLILLGVSVAVWRRRQVRRRRQALLATPAAGPTGADDDPEGGGGGGVVHHVWFIRTVGLDEAAIGSIAATRYRAAGAGLLGTADCTVCLGEFRDGELVRLLPKCGHAFHVPCIDTWLRAHVNCPLCRSDVLDPAVTTDTTTGDGAETSATPPADPVEDNNAAAEQADATTGNAMAEHEQEQGDQHPEASPAEEDQHEQSRSPEPPPPCPSPHNVRRAASMDAAIVSTAADVAAALEHLPEAAGPEEEQSGRQKRGTAPSCAKASGSGHRSNLTTDRPASGGIPRSFFSRHCRARSSVLPL